MTVEGEPEPFDGRAVGPGCGQGAVRQLGDEQPQPVDEAVVAGTDEAQVAWRVGASPVAGPDVVGVEATHQMAAREAASSIPGLQQTPEPLGHRLAVVGDRHGAVWPMLGHGERCLAHGGLGGVGSHRDAVAAHAQCPATIGEPSIEMQDDLRGRHRLRPQHPGDEGHGPALGDRYSLGRNCALGNGGDEAGGHLARTFSVNTVVPSGWADQLKEGGGGWEGWPSSQRR